MISKEKNLALKEQLFWILPGSRINSASARSCDSLEAGITTRFLTKKDFGIFLIPFGKV